MHTYYLLVNNSTAGEAVEAIRECLPQFDPKSTLALVVEPIDAIDTGALVVATQNEEILRVFDFVGEKQADCLQ